MTTLNIIFPIDYILIIITLLFIILGAWKGFIQSVLGLMTWLGSILITLYSYAEFANFINSQLMKIKIFQNYEFLSNILSITIAVPIIFLLSLLILKRIRKIISSDIDKQILGVLLDKLFGIIYGIIFSYFIFSTILFAANRFQLEDLNIWIINNSEIMKNINIINNEYFFNIFTFENSEIL